MSRLASLTPSRSRASPSPSPSPSPITQITETTHHRMLKILIQELRNVFKTWDELVLVDGMKAGKGCIDAMTEMDNLLQVEETPERPGISGHLRGLYTSREALIGVMVKFDRLLSKLSLLIDQAEKIFFDAYRLQGSDFVINEALWLSWTLEHFVNTLPPLLSLHNNHLTILQTLAQTIKDPKTDFDTAKLALERWRDLGIGGERWEGVREWEELVELELAGMGGEDEDEVQMAAVTGSGRRKGRK